MKSLQLRGLKVQTWPRVFTKMLETVEGTGGALPLLSGESLAPCCISRRMLLSARPTAEQWHKL